MTTLYHYKIFEFFLQFFFVQKSFRDKKICPTKFVTITSSAITFFDKIFICREEKKSLLINFIDINNILKMYYETYTDNFCRKKCNN